MKRLLPMPDSFIDLVEFDARETPATGGSTIYVHVRHNPHNPVQMPVSRLDSQWDVNERKERMVHALWTLQDEAWEEVSSFADAPETISELRANRDRKGRHLTSRDPAIMFLRDLDAGKLPHAEHVVVAWRNRFPEPRPDGTEITVEYIAQSGDIHTSVGLLEDVKMHMVKDAT